MTMEKDEIVKYWLESSVGDYQVMQSLFDSWHYVWALFLSHLVVEKLLKAYYVKNVGMNYPRIHDLIEIAAKAALDLSTDQKVFLEDLSTFNLRVRYPDYKNRLQKKVNRQYTEVQLTRVREIRQWLREKINN